MECILAMSLFILVAGFTPGPNNLIAMSIGFNHGRRAVLPHLFGVSVGFPVMLLILGFGLEPFLMKHPLLLNTLKYLSLAYILFLAYKIAASGTEGAKTVKAKPITFGQSLIFQWINPKAWAGALATISIYVPKEKYTPCLMAAAFLSLLSILGAITLWTSMGKRISTYLGNPLHQKIFNITMALLLLLSVGMMLL